MDDYISRDEARKAFLKALSKNSDREKSAIDWHNCKVILGSIPAADVRPVVLCRDCRWWTKQEKSLQGRCELAGFYPTGGWFCANGERPNCGADMREVQEDGEKA